MTLLDRVNAGVRLFNHYAVQVQLVCAWTLAEEVTALLSTHGQAEPARKMKKVVQFLKELECPAHGWVDCYRLPLSLHDLEMNALGLEAYLSRQEEILSSL